MYYFLLVGLIDIYLNKKVNYTLNIPNSMISNIILSKLCYSRQAHV